MKTDDVVRIPELNNLQRLEIWSANQAETVWDRGRALRIETLDDPGWRVRIDLRGTALAMREYPDVRDLCPGAGWLHCRVRDGWFEGCGGPYKLDEILGRFLDWAQREAPVAS